MSGSEGLFRAKKYYAGLAFILILFGGFAFFGDVPFPGFWKGIILSFFLSLVSYSIRFYLLWKHSQDGFLAQFGTSVLFFFIQAACLFLFIWRGEREGFVIGFFIAHFANLLILVFAR